VGSRGADGERLEEVLRLLSSLKGVRHAFYISDDVRAKLRDMEGEYPLAGPVPVRNEGVPECLEREHVACIIKDKTFRPPPVPTVMLVDSDGVVIGWELIPGKELRKEPGKRYLFLGKDFVICHDGRSGRNAKFVLPPVPFGELDRVEGVRGVCSSSPSTVGDLYLRKSAGLEDDPKLASILVGFDLLQRR
jgi:hypothetical protein